MSGVSNVRYWCRKRDIEPTDELAHVILAKAKEGKRLMTDDEVLAVIEAQREG